MKETMHLWEKMELLTRKGIEFRKVSLRKYRYPDSLFYSEILQDSMLLRCEARAHLVGHLILYFVLRLVMIGDCCDFIV